MKEPNRGALFGPTAAVVHRGGQALVPGKQVEYGIITATKDDCYKPSVRLSINGARAFSFSKNHIGIPKNGVAVEDTELFPVVESDNEGVSPDERPVIDLVDEL